MKQVHAREAALGDTVRVLTQHDIEGDVVGVSNHSGSVLVRWDSECMDVIDVGSPLWATVSVYRDDNHEQPGTTVSFGEAVWRAAYQGVDYQGRGTTFAPIEPTETFETVYDGHQPGTERYAIEVPPGFEPVRDADGRATGIAPVLTLPWGMPSDEGGE